MADETVHHPGIGDNATPTVEQHLATMRELAIEAEAWLSGADIRDDDAALKLAEFLTLVADAERDAKAAKEAEYRPVKTTLDGITGAWAPVLEEAARIRDVARPVLTKWQQHKDALARLAVEAARADAEEKRQAASAAMQASRGDREARREAEELAWDAKTAAIAASVVAKLPTRMKVGGRSVQMRRRYEAVISGDPDSRDSAIAYLWTEFEQVWSEALAPRIKAMAVETIRARDPKPGEYKLAGGAIVVTVTEEAV